MFFNFDLLNSRTYAIDCNISDFGRVTQDVVSGLPIKKGELSGRQYLPPSEASVESDKSVFEKKTLIGDTNTDLSD